MEERLDDIAETAAREMGKTLAETKGETLRGIAILRYYAGEGLRKNGDVIPASDAKALMYTTRVPLGVVAVITRWNFPIAISRKRPLLSFTAIQSSSSLLQKRQLRAQKWLHALKRPGCPLAS